MDQIIDTTGSAEDDFDDLPPLAPLAPWQDCYVVVPLGYNDGVTEFSSHHPHPNSVSFHGVAQVPLLTLKPEAFAADQLDKTAETLARIVSAGSISEKRFPVLVVARNIGDWKVVRPFVEAVAKHYGAKNITVALSDAWLESLRSALGNEQSTLNKELEAAKGKKTDVSQIESRLRALEESWLRPGFYIGVSQIPQWLQAHCVAL